MKGYPEWTSVTRLVEGGETPVFKQFFISWYDSTDQKGLGEIHNVGSIVGRVFSSLAKELNDTFALL